MVGARGQGPLFFNRDMKIFRNTIHLGDAYEFLKLLPAKSVHSCVSSPPYYALRNYGIPTTEWPEVTFTIFGFPVTIPAETCCLGLERTPMAFTAHIVLIYREVMRVLRDDGTVWLNMGDSYAGYWGENYAHKPFGDDRTPDESTPPNKPSFNFKKRPSDQTTSTLLGSKDTQMNALRAHEVATFPGVKPKDMIGIPWMLAYALRDDGWFLRSDIIWHKPNPMPESVRDRPTKAHEYIFLLSKSDRYYYDHYAIKTPPKESSVINGKNGEQIMANKYAWGRAMEGSIDDNRKDQGREIGKQKRKEKSGYKELPDWNKMSPEEQMSIGANKRTVWEIATHSYKEAHFATFPEELPATCIKASTSELCCAKCGSPYKRLVEEKLVPGVGASKTFVVDERDEQADDNSQGSNRQKAGHKPGHILETRTTGWKKTCKCDTDKTANAVVLDMFSGSGTTAMVARKLNRDYFACDLNPKYVGMSGNRLHKEVGLFQ